MLMALTPSSPAASISPSISPSAQPSPRRGLERVPDPPHRHAASHAACDAAWPRSSGGCCCCCCGGGGVAGGAAAQAECSAQLRVLLCGHADEAGRCEEHLPRVGTRLGLAHRGARTGCLLE